ncbi:MAG: plasmid replication protein, CyRepA1 family [Cyanobacteriota bacterium]|nr:plasmid replication protein, CyRepA1 family [Cyanobacteriota bacterium]
MSTITATQTTTVVTGPIGSSWDACNGPEGTLAHHLREWVEDSACHPALAAANLLSLQGADVLQALAGDRLEALEGEASQYSTVAVAQLLRPLEPVAEGGGWWCSGLDPLAGWAPMGWGQFKPDRPRWDSKRNRPRKLENPVGIAARTVWLRVPAVVAAIVANRFKLALPIDVGADVDGSKGAFWRWWESQIRLPLVPIEGIKKAGALLSIGIPAVGLSGIWPGATARAELLALPLKGRSVWVLFDHSTREDPDEPKAADRLGRELARVGAKVRVGIVPGTHGKGADDHLVNGGSWEELFASLQPLKPAPALHRLRQPDVVAPPGYLSQFITLPDGKRLVVVRAPMGSGKTDWIAKVVARYQHEGRRVVLITHRRSLGAASAEKIGLPWADEAAPGSDLRQTGIALCIDSLHPGSALQFRASEWSDAVVIIDEAAQVLHHAVMGRGTAVADRRAEILVQLSELLAHAHLVIAADAQLADPHLEALEAAVGERAWLIGSAHRPAANRVLFVHPSRDSWRLKLKEAIQNRWRIWISTTAKDQGPNSAKHLAELIKTHWPDARILVVDSDTVADPTHDAHRLAADPNGISAAYDVVITTPAIQSGLSIDKTPFDVVFSIAGGNTAPEGVVQSMGRVRCDCPRHLYAPLQSPGNRLKIGSGSTDPKQILRSHDHHMTVVVGQLARAGVNLETGSIGPWLLLWAKLVAHQNRQAMAFCPTVVALMEEQGCAVTYLEKIAPEQQSEAITIGQELKAFAETAQAAADEAVRKVEVISDCEAQELLKKRRLTPSQKTAITRWRLDRSWGLRGTAPSQDLLDQDRDGAWKSHRFRWLLISKPSTEPLVDAHDRAIAAKIKWAPDLTHQTLGTKVATALALGLRGWLQRVGGDSFTAEDPDVVRLQATALALRHDLRQVLGIEPAQTGVKTLRRLLRLVGARLESRRKFGPLIPGQKRETHYTYRVVIDAPPDGVDPSALPGVFASSLKEVCTKKSPT